MCHISCGLVSTAEAEAFLADYDERVDDIASRLPDELVEASVIRWMPDGPLVMLPNSFSSLVLADVGIGRPTAHAAMEGFHPVHSDVISMEQIQVIDSDIIFAGGLNPDGASALDSALDNVLLQSLTAVQSDRLIVVDGLVWGSVGGPLAALEVLDDIERGLGKFEPVTNVDSPCAEDQRLFDHEYSLNRPVCISVNPERVLPLDLNSIEYMLVMDLPFVSSTELGIFFMGLLIRNGQKLLLAAQRVYPIPVSSHST